MVPNVKPCTKCGEVKPLEQFSRAKAGRYGRRGECKACAMAAQRILRGHTARDLEAQPHPSSGRRRCSTCQTIKQLDEFSPPRERTRRGRTFLEYEVRCLDCNAKRRRIAAGYDTPADYQPGRRPPALSRAERQERSRQAVREDYVRNRAKRQAAGRVQAQRWREANRERHRQAARDWRAANRQRQAEQSSIKRARLAGAWVEEVDRLVLLERDDGVCGICGQDVDPFAFEVDHIVPLSRGGPHSYANTQPAHPFCNNSKHNRL